MKKLLTKSLFLTGLQCEKLLWTSVFDKNKIPNPSHALINKSCIGYQVEKLAKLMFKNAVDLSNEKNIQTAAENTIHLMKIGKTVLEAVFITDKCYARTDIVTKNNDNTYSIYEIKSSTEENESYYYDIAFQKFCCEKSGFKIKNLFLILINKNFIKNGNIEQEKIFNIINVTDKVNAASTNIKSKISHLSKICSLRKAPNNLIGKFCLKPTECPLKLYCWRRVPKDSVFSLYRINKDKAFNLFHSGTIKISQIKNIDDFSEKNKIQFCCDKTQKPYVNKKFISSFLNSLSFPQYHLDFETFATPIPIYNQSKPYQQIPFQFSLHIWSSYNSKPTHHSFLADGNKDPRPEFMKQLYKLLGHNGSIIVYNKSFEINRLKECAQIMPEYNFWLENNILPRIVDLLTPFKNFWLYHPKQNGSASIKKVLPALCSKSYNGMNIANGETASAEFIRTHLANVPTDDIKTVRKNLIEYCKLDTQAMIDIINAMQNLVK